MLRIGKVIADSLDAGGERFHPRIHRVEHHIAHMSSAFYVSPFDTAAVGLRIVEEICRFVAVLGAPSGTAKPLPPVQIRAAPPTFVVHSGDTARRRRDGAMLVALTGRVNTPIICTVHGTGRTVPVLGTAGARPRRSWSSSSSEG